MRKGYSLFGNYFNVLKELGIYGNVASVPLGIALDNYLLGELDGILVLHSVSRRLIDIGRKLWKNVEVVLVRKLYTVDDDTLGEMAGIAKEMVIPSGIDKDGCSRIVYSDVLKNNVTLPGAAVITTKSNNRIRMEQSVLDVQSSLSDNAELLMTYLTVFNGCIIRALMRVKAREHTAVIGKVLAVVTAH